MIEDFNVVFSILLFLLFERDEELLLLFTRRRRRRLLIILGGSENEDAAWDIFLRNFYLHVSSAGKTHLTTSIKYYSFLLFLVVVHCFVRLFHAFELKFRLSLQR